MNYWNETPLFRFLLLFIAGILLAVYNPCFSFQSALMTFIILTAGFFIQYFLRRKIARYRGRWFQGIWSYICVFFMGYLMTMLATEKSYPAHFRNFRNTSGFIGYLTEPPKEKTNSYKTIVEILFVLEGTEWKRASGNCLTYMSIDASSSNLRYGDLIVSEVNPVEVLPPSNPSQFDYKRWLGFHGIYDQVFLSSGKWKLLERHFGNPIYEFSFGLRKHLLDVFETNHITGQDHAVISALILGYEDEIDQDVISAYAAAGAMHILSVSGLHVGIIYVAINFFLGFLNRNRKTRLFKSLLIILFLWFYALLTGLSPSVLRSATMFSFIIIGQMTGHHTNLYNTLSASAFFLLALNPFLLFQVGFQLSYMAVLGIIFLQPAIQAWFDPDVFILRQIWSLTSVSIAAQLATFPLGLFYFHQFPVYFLFSNLIVIPVSTVIIYGGILLLAVSSWHWAASVIGFLLGYVVHFMNAVVSFTEHLPYSLINEISISTFETWILYFSIITMSSFFFIKEHRYLLWSVASVVVLMSGQITEQWQLNNQKKLIVYSMKGKSFVNIIDGKKNIVLADSSTTGNKSLLMFNVCNYWWDCGLGVNDILHAGDSSRILNGSYYKNFFQYGNRRIAIVRDSTMIAGSSGPVDVDFLILSTNSRLDLKNLMNRFRFRNLIVDSSVNAGRETKIIKEAKQLDIEVYSVRKKGAFVFDLSSE